MAISKILYMKDCGGHFHGKHLKQSLDYIMNPEKTQDGRLIGGLNCQPESAFEQMKETKRNFGKIDKRQGYHLILSFKEGEVSPDTAYEITKRFAEEYLGSRFEAVYCVHDNTDHVHSHIVFNSVSFIDGKKYRYEKGDWAKDIQPITNRLCEEYGLSTIDIGAGKEEREEHYKEWSEYQDGRFVWGGMIVRDLDACILQAGDFDDFLELLKEKGYDIKQGKYLSVKPPGMGRFRRCKTLGADYSEERIRERIQTEDLSFYQSVQNERKPQIVKCYVKRYRRTKLSGMQKRYYAKLYRIGKLKKRPYSQAWKYRDDIKKMQKLQQQYLFLVRHDIHTMEELAFTVSDLTDKRKDASLEKSRVYRARAKCKALFDLAEQMTELEFAEEGYQSGDNYFASEHSQWIELSERLKAEGYSLEEVKKLREYYREQAAYSCQKERASIRELNLGKTIMNDFISASGEQAKQNEQSIEKNRERTETKQPVR